MTDAPVRVVLADDDRLLRAGLAKILEAAGLDVVAQVGDAVGLRAAVSATHPAVAIVDIRMPPDNRCDGLAAALDIRRDHPGVGVLLLSKYRESHYLKTLFGGSARGVGYVLKDRISDADFVDIVRTIAGGGSVLDPEVVALMMGNRSDDLRTLSRREREVLALMAQGRTNRAIGQRLELTRQTVESHVSSIFRKLGLEDNPDDHRRVLAVLRYLQADDQG
jgi:DNA-binding NarL/FixJ family response regulator